LININWINIYSFYFLVLLTQFYDYTIECGPNPNPNGQVEAAPAAASTTCKL